MTESDSVIAGKDVQKSDKNSAANKFSPTRIAVLPDCQTREGDDFQFLDWIGQYLVKMKPDIIVCLGDFADMPSLSTHDKPGSKGLEGTRYKLDIAASRRAMETLMGPIKVEQERLKTNKKAVWSPRLVMTLGNHEDRIDRAIKNDPRLEGLISIDDLEYQKWGWEVIPFLETIVIEGICFSHYFSSGVLGKPVTTASALIAKKHMSCFAGHQQGKQIAYSQRADGQDIIAIISGSCYEHSEGYLNAQTNKHWKGLWLLNDVDNGSFDELPVSLKYIRRKYGNN